MDDEYRIDSFLAVIAVVCFTILGLLFGCLFTNWSWEKDLVQRGFGYYYVNPEVGGEAVFHFKESTWQGVLDGGYVSPFKNPEADAD